MSQLCDHQGTGKNTLKVVVPKAGRVRSDEMILDLISIRDFSICLSGHLWTGPLQVAQRSSWTTANPPVPGSSCAFFTSSRSILISPEPSRSKRRWFMFAGCSTCQAQGLTTTIAFPTLSSPVKYMTGLSHLGAGRVCHAWSWRAADSVCVPIRRNGWSQHISSG